MTVATPMRFAEKGKPYYDDDGRQRCGAKTSAGRPCRAYPVTGRNRCDKHGGLTPVGIASPSYRHGRYSEHVPRRLNERYDRARNDPDLLNMTDQFALLDARLADTLKRSDLGEAGRLWLELRRQWSTFHQAKAGGDVPGMEAAIASIDRLVAKGAGEAAAWQEVGELIERQRKLMESEGKRRVTMKLMATDEQVNEIVGYIVQAAHETVHDPDTLRALSARFSQLVSTGGL